MLFMVITGRILLCIINNNMKSVLLNKEYRVNQYGTGSPSPTCPSSRKDDLSLVTSNLEYPGWSSCGLALMGEREGRDAATVVV